MPAPGDLVKLPWGPKDSREFRLVRVIEEPPPAPSDPDDWYRCPWPHPLTLICPSCGCPVKASYACHTYGSGDKFYACLPCDSAMDFECVGDARYGEPPCGWGYTWGLNPANPRSAGNEVYRPKWLQGDFPDKWID